MERQEKARLDQEEALNLGVALDSSIVQRIRQSKNVIFGSQFLNDLTELQQHSVVESESQTMLR